MSVVRNHLIAAALAVLVPLSVSAQEVRDREANQQGRIAHGLQSGQITASEAAQLEHRETSINAQRRVDLATDGGHLTAGERHNLNQREDSLSRQIYRDRHNDVAQPGVVPRH